MMKHLDTRLIKDKYIIEWFFLISIILFCFLTMGYSDNLITSEISLGLTESVFTGRFVQFFNSFDWSYGFTVYTIYAIWGIPVWIISQLFHIPVYDIMSTSIPILLWYKALNAVFAVIALIYLRKIVRELGLGDKGISIVSFSFLSSVLLVLPVFCISQSDIMSTAFTLISIYYLLQRKHKRFILYMLLAVSAKYYAIIVFIPILLLLIKRIRYLMYLVGGTLAGGTTYIALLRLSSGVKYVMDNDSGFYVFGEIKNVFSNTIFEEERAVSLFAIVYVLVCVFAYTVDLKKSEEYRKRMFIYIPFIAYATFFALVDTNIYRYVILAPFIIIVCFFDKKYCNILLTLELLFSISIVLVAASMGYWIIGGGQTFSHLILRDYSYPMQLLRMNSIEFFLNQFMNLKLEELLPLIRGVSVAALLAIAYLTFPRALTAEQEGGIEIDRSVLWIRVLTLATWVAICLFTMNITFTDSFKDATLDGATGKRTNCRVEAEMLETGDESWMSEELTIRVPGQCVGDLQIDVYGYFAISDTDVEVYVNNSKVGILEAAEDQNITTRTCLIDQSYLSDKNVQEVTLRADNGMMTEDNIWISMAIYELNIHEVQNGF